MLNKIKPSYAIGIVIPLAVGLLSAFLTKNSMDIYTSITKPAAYLQIPYLLWVSFAGYLNLIFTFSINKKGSLRFLFYLLRIIYPRLSSYHKKLLLPCLLR